MKTELTTEDKELIIRFSEYLDEHPEYSDEFKTSALKKFAKGRLEHNEDIMKIKCQKEILFEKMDIEAYKFIQIIQNE